MDVLSVVENSYDSEQPGAEATPDGSRREHEEWILSIYRHFLWCPVQRGKPLAFVT